MTSITSELAKQYSDSQKLAARARIKSKYTIAEVDWFPWVARQLPLQARDRVLDIGCGPGWFWEAVVSVLPEALDLTLADLSPGMVQEAVERCLTLPFGSVRGRQADASALPFVEGSFDALIAMHMLYHVPDPAKGIAEIYRVLKPGGFLAVTTSGARNLRRMYELTTVFGSPPSDPAAAAFGFDTAERLDAVPIRQRHHVAASCKASDHGARRCLPGAHVLSTWGWRQRGSTCRVTQSHRQRISARQWCS